MPPTFREFLHRQVEAFLADEGIAWEPDRIALLVEHLAGNWEMVLAASEHLSGVGHGRA